MNTKSEKSLQGARFDPDVPVELIKRDTTQPRKQFDIDALKELAESIRVHGVIQPVVLRNNPDFGKNGDTCRYILIAGERRWRAAQLAGQFFIPGLIRTIDTFSSSIVSYVENIQRVDLTPMEEAWATKLVVQRYEALNHKAPQQAAADLIGKSRAYVTNLMRILQLSADTCELAQAHPDKISKGHLTPLVGLEPHHQLSLLARVVTEKLSARDVERGSRRLKLEKELSANPTSRETLSEEIAITRLEQEMSEIIGAKLQIERVANKWELNISCHSMPEVEGVLERLGKRFDSDATD